MNTSNDIKFKEYTTEIWRLMADPRTIPLWIMHIESMFLDWCAYLACYQADSVKWSDVHSIDSWMNSWFDLCGDYVRTVSFLGNYERQVSCVPPEDKVGGEFNAE